MGNCIFTHCVALAIDGLSTRSVSNGRIERLWRREGLKVRQKQPKKRQLWLNDGSCVRPRPEFIAQAVRDWIAAVGAKTAYIEPGSLWENGYCESFHGRFRDELLTGYIFYSLQEAQIIIEEWRKHYNTTRPHSALGYRPPAPGAVITKDQRPIMH